MKRKPVTPQGQPFGERLAELRRRVGLSQRALAAELGISQRMVAYYESQSDYPPAHLLAPLTEVLGLSADELLGIKPLKTPRGPTNQRLWHRFQQIEKLPSPSAGSSSASSTPSSIATASCKRPADPPCARRRSRARAGPRRACRVRGCRPRRHQVRWPRRDASLSETAPTAAHPPRRGM
ncbi:MAG: helix-turn-helix transcriptional regulator [Polyangiaceae bacterium]|nr:helix-turn-helix transcriptional regulator [Polyangiaceae bacterium]